MQEIDPTSRNGPTPGCSTMSNLLSCQVMTTNMPVAGPSGISHTSYEKIRADFQVSLCAIVKRNYINCSWRRNEQRSQFKDTRGCYAGNC